MLKNYDIMDELLFTYVEGIINRTLKCCCYWSLLFDNEPSNILYNNINSKFHRMNYYFTETINSLYNMHSQQMAFTACVANTLSQDPWALKLD